MPSHLRLQAQFEPISATATYQTSPTSPPAKKQRMSLTQTYYVASTARSKLGREAQKADHNLRLLVGHANLLDTLMLELSSVEKEQERWFNESVKKASKPEQPQHIQWIDTISEVDEMDEDDDSEDESDFEDDAADIFNIPLRKMRSPPMVLDSANLDIDMINEDEDEDEEEDDEDDDEEHTLTRVPSSRHSPPELVDDSESDSEDESMPTSPESQSFEINEKEREHIATSALYDMKAQRGVEDYVMQQARQPQAPLIAAY
ncbi:hypothetical protein LTR62_004100 [Meristemomyces frigidus]|uniref:Uncharacterized protein n=1 Tax=Meristemomyces frigidus TaxID=1508187 RepID=A0AAN7TI07_9PEZI|nr:hypothetical protein LTR62_004100 [Meristemomyces frigidus]